MTGYRLGFDLGGTGVRVVVVGESGAGAGLALQTRDFTVDPVGQLIAAARRVMPEGRELLGIGIGSAGPIDLRTGEINNPNSLPQFTGRDIVTNLADAFGVPVCIDNDAVVAALAEYAWGIPHRVRSLLCVTLGTGVGVAMIDNGRPVRGADGQHPESGHLGVPGTGNPCYCGLEQCWEQVASRAALDRLRTTWSSDAAALWSHYAGQLAAGLLSMLTVYRPEAVAISGSVAQHWAELEAPLHDALAHHPDFTSKGALFASTLGPFGGASGATLLARDGIGFRRDPSL